MKKLEELFNLGPTPIGNEVQETSQQGTIDPEQALAAYAQTSEDIDKIDKALPLVRALEATDAEMDELAEMAKSNAQNLYELGMNVDPRFSGTIFQSVGVLLGHAITARQAKIDKKLRTISLQIQKARLDLAEKRATQTKDTEVTDEISGEATVLDRNSLLEMILNNPAKSSSGESK
jgi:hypothetical protein